MTTAREVRSEEGSSRVETLVVKGRYYLGGSSVSTAAVVWRPGASSRHIQNPIAFVGFVVELICIRLCSFLTGQVLQALQEKGIAADATTVLTKIKQKTGMARKRQGKQTIDKDDATEQAAKQNGQMSAFVEHMANEIEEELCGAEEEKHKEVEEKKKKKKKKKNNNKKEEVYNMDACQDIPLCRQMSLFSLKQLCLQRAKGLLMGYMLKELMKRNKGVHFLKRYHQNLHTSRLAYAKAPAMAQNDAQIDAFVGLNALKDALELERKELQDEVDKHVWDIRDNEEKRYAKRVQHDALQKFIDRQRDVAKVMDLESPEQVPRCLCEAARKQMATLQNEMSECKEKQRDAEEAANKAEAKQREILHESCLHKIDMPLLTLLEIVNFATSLHHKYVSNACPRVPDEILHLVFAHIPGPVLMQRCKLVHTSWNVLLQENRYRASPRSFQMSEDGLLYTIQKSHVLSTHSGVAMRDYYQTFSFSSIFSGCRRNPINGEIILDLSHSSLAGYKVVAWVHGELDDDADVPVDGEVRRGDFHGHGKLAYRDGRVYEGEFREGKRHGYGTLTYPDGRVDEGGWSLGKRLYEINHPDSGIIPVENGKNEYVVLKLMQEEDCPDDATRCNQFQIKLDPKSRWTGKEPVALAYFCDDKDGKAVLQHRSPRLDVDAKFMRSSQLECCIEKVKDVLNSRSVEIVSLFFLNKNAMTVPNDRLFFSVKDDKAQIRLCIVEIKVKVYGERDFVVTELLRQSQNVSIKCVSESGIIILHKPGCGLLWWRVNWRHLSYGVETLSRCYESFFESLMHPLCLLSAEEGCRLISTSKIHGVFVLGKTVHLFGVQKIGTEGRAMKNLNHIGMSSIEEGKAIAQSQVEVPSGIVATACFGRAGSPWWTPSDASSQASSPSHGITIIIDGNGDALYLGWHPTLGCYKPSQEFTKVPMDIFNLPPDTILKDVAVNHNTIVFHAMDGILVCKASENVQRRWGFFYPFAKMNGIVADSATKVEYVRIGDEYKVKITTFVDGVAGLWHLKVPSQSGIYCFDCVGEVCRARSAFTNGKEKEQDEFFSSVDVVIIERLYNDDGGCCC